MIGHVLGWLVVLGLWLVVSAVTAPFLAAWLRRRADRDAEWARRHRCNVEPSRAIQVRRDPSPTRRLTDYDYRALAEGDAQR